MRLPGIVPLAFFLFLVPALVPVIERFWPTATTWWSALIVASLGAAVSMIWLIYRSQLAGAGMPPPAAAPSMPDPDIEDYTYADVKLPHERSAMRTFLFG